MGSSLPWRRGPGNAISKARAIWKTARDRPATSSSVSAATQNRLAKFVPEGIEGRVPHRGPLDPGLHSLWAACVPAWAIWAVAASEELQQNARFIRISNAGLRESTSRCDHHP